MVLLLFHRMDSVSCDRKSGEARNDGVASLLSGVDSVHVHVNCRKDYTRACRCVSVDVVAPVDGSELAPKKALDR